MVDVDDRSLQAHFTSRLGWSEGRQLLVAVLNSSDKLVKSRKSQCLSRRKQHKHCRKY